jgi:tetratricopeptide (TPR) repeat protein
MLNRPFPIALDKCSGISKIVLVCIVLVFITLAVYMQTGDHEFLNFDDYVYITKNPHVAAGLKSSNVAWAFTSIEEGNWFPITRLSHMTDVQLYGMSPSGHHLTNVAIHTLSALLLFLLFLRLSGGLWQSAFVAFLFALHPLHVESVAWVAERKDVLSGLFWFLTLIFYAEYVERRKISLYILALFSFVLGLMSKPMLVTLPIVMLLMDFWPLGRFRCGEQGPGLRQFINRALPLIKEKLPFFLCSFFSALITIYAQQKGGAIANLAAAPFQLRFENALVAYVKYIGKTIWPHDLAVLYPFPSSIPLWQVISSLFIMLLVSAAAVWTGRRRPYLAVGWFWFLITLVPVIGLIQVGVQSMADRYSYIPVIGLFIMAAWGVPDLTKGLKHRQGILALLAGTVITASAALTWQQLGYWKDSFSLFQHTLQVTTGNYIIHNNLGNVFADTGNLDTAISEFREAIRIRPNFIEARNSLGLVLVRKGNLDAAIKEYQKALWINPSKQYVHYNLGIALASKGDLDAAIREYQKELEINPNYTKALNNLGIALAGKDDLDAALRKFKEALRINPNDEMAHINLGIALDLKRMKNDTRK